MLTDNTCRKAKPTTKAFKLFDGGGMFLAVLPSGTKAWRLKYRVGGKERLLSLGTYPEVSLAGARTKRDELRRQIHEGIDPSAQRKAQKAAQAEIAVNTFEAVALEWLARFSPGWAPTHTRGVDRILKKDVLPWLGSKLIADLKAPEVLAVLRRIESRGALETAHRARTNIGQVCRFAVATGRAEGDPTAALRGALPATKPDHFAAVIEPAKLGDLLRVIWTYNEGTPIVAAALKMAAMLFVRPGELRVAQWSDIDLDKAQWAFTISKTGQPHIVCLAAQAVEVLKELQLLTGRGRYVFPSARTNTRPMSDAAVNAALRRLGIDKATASGHGFRASARTLLDEVLGFRPDLIEAQLGHAVRDANGRAYNRTSFLLERKKMMQEWADYLDKLRADVKILPFVREAATAG
jgi:integrase